MVKGIDIRRYGSGNVGASNFATHVGRKWGVPLVLFDVIVKGAVPVLVASDKVLGLGIWAEAFAGLAAIVGHNWSVFIRFSGGRGMATVLGTSGALSLPLCAIYNFTALGVWLAIRRKDSAIAWAAAALSLPFASLALRLPIAVTTFCVLFVIVTGLKRLTSNMGNPAFASAEKRPAWRLMLNRLMFDRDTERREDWVRRGPG
jgi:glycerol-3-phosphate acyltransferase PlsY